uniref:Uncharacterized protein n=1 Tax=Anguilla anguilla TaxID=7936 RepID=A0A0E9TUK3_ANGAN
MAIWVSSSPISFHLDLFCYSTSF